MSSANGTRFVNSIATDPNLVDEGSVLSSISTTSLPTSNKPTVVASATYGYKPTSGLFVPLELSASNGVKIDSQSGTSFSEFNDYGANTTLNVKVSAGKVYSITCYNRSSSDRFIQIHNTATVPAASAVPIKSYLIPKFSQTLIGTDMLGTSGLSCSLGIAFAFSTDYRIYTAGTATNQDTQISFI